MEPEALSLPQADSLDAPPVPPSPPPLGLEEWQALEPVVRKLWRTQALIVLAVLLGVFGAVEAILHLALDRSFPPAVGTLALTALLGGPGLLLVDRTYREYCYRVTDDEVGVRHGVFWKSERYIPRKRIQHVDISAGPVERKLGLCTLQVHVAASMACQIPGMDPGRAERIREALIGVSVRDGGIRG